MSYLISHIAHITNASAAIVTDTKIEHLLLDSRKIYSPATSLFFALKGVRRDGHQFIPELYKKGIRNFVVTQKVDMVICPEANFLLVKDSLVALQQLTAHHRQQFNFPVIGITGSNGKTIVKEWLYQLLQEDFTIVRSPKSYNSQIGVPLSVWQMNEQHTLAIFEAVSERIVCANHFQSELLKKNKNNADFRTNSSSAYRYFRLNELLDIAGVLDVQKVVKILRNPYGVKNEKIGWGNEKAMNQLIAHHSIIIRPGIPDFWVSTNPWQLGKYLHFDLNKVFIKNEFPIDLSTTIPEDTLLMHSVYPDFIKYKNIRSKIHAEKKLSDDELKALVVVNPDFYETYELLGDYYYNITMNKKAGIQYKLALSKVIPTQKDSMRLIKKLNKLK